MLIIVKARNSHKRSIICVVLASSLIFEGSLARAEEPSTVKLVPLPESSQIEMPLSAFKTDQGNLSTDPNVLKINEFIFEFKDRAPLRQNFKPSAALQNQNDPSIDSFRDALPSIHKLNSLSIQSEFVKSESKQIRALSDIPDIKHKIPKKPRLTPLKQLRSKDIVAPNNQQAQHADISPVQVEDALEIKMSPIGTPRQIKVKDKNKLLKVSPQPAYATAEADRDEQTVMGFLNNYRAYLRIDEPDKELSLDRKERDELNRRHFRFSQRYQGLPVWPSELIVHLDAEGTVDLVNGAFVPTPRKLVTTPVVSAEEAVTAARAYVPDSSNAEASQPELIIYGSKDKPARLAWKLELNISIGSHWLVVVDALNRQVLTAFNTVKLGNVVGSGNDLFGIPRQLNLWSDNNTYYLIDTSKSMFDNTSILPQSSTSRGAIHILDAKNQPPIDNLNNINVKTMTFYYLTSNNITSGWLRDGVSASYSFSTIYDYYLSRHNRNSIDGKGSGIKATVRLGSNLQNACWSSATKSMFFGDGNNYAGALDIVGHEATHGVTDYSAKLIYEYQSGALNEAFSDIFGTNIKYFATGATDWLIGSDLGTPARNLKNPSAIIKPGYGPLPSKMSEYYKLNLSSDLGGVHINSSIVNHVYYLLAEGLNGAIGIRDAERIFYRALTNHLTQQSDFLDARLACIQSAKEIFGDGSVQVTKTAEAFDAVEIFDNTPSPAPNPAPSVNGADAVLFVSYDSRYGYNRIARRETALGDSALGHWLSLSQYAVEYSRPSITADGTLAAYVKDDNDMCLVYSDDSNGKTDECLNMPGAVHSVAMSPDGDHYGFVLLDQNGNPENKITVIDTGTNQAKTYSLVAPTSAGITIDSIDHADAMVFTSDSRFLIYDALNILKLADGSNIAAWSIYAIDLVTGGTLLVVPPNQNLDIAYPALGHTSDDFITFEANSPSTGNSTIFAGNLRTGKVATVATVNNDYGVPGYTGDDTAIIFSQPDASQPTLHSIYRQPLASDIMTPAGSPALWLQDGDFAVVYRRGAYSKLTVGNNDAGSGGVNSDKGGISCGDRCSFIYPSGTTVTLTARAYTGARFAGWGGACSGLGPCTVTLSEDKTVTATFATNPVNGTCGSANGGSFTTAPTASLCISGTATAVVGSGPWYWQCNGLYGGTSASCSANLLVHNSAGFNEDAYLAANTDVAAAVRNGLIAAGWLHYSLFGKNEGRLTAPATYGTFNEDAYLAANPDVTAAVKTSLIATGWQHYSMFGKNEGRLTVPATYGTFSEDAYLAANPDVAAAVKTGLIATGWQHYSMFGKSEGRLTVPATYGTFSEDAYLAANLDVATAVKTGLIATGWQHYSMFGKNEGRRTAPVGYFDLDP